MDPVKKQLEILKSGAAEIIPEDEFVKKLEKSIKTRTPLKIKEGLDPTVPDIHLGHTVTLHKLKQFQDLGHQVMVVIGDFTAMVGDPTGRSEMRKRVSRAEVLENAETYKKQIFKILHPKKTKVVFNSRWLGAMKFEDVLHLTAKYTVARMLERDDFYNRYRNQQPISVLEFLYPLMQAYDSVALQADLELGGTDQKFNLLVGREIQREYGQEPQVVMLMPLLVGTDGKEKMSKSLGNYVGVTDPPDQMYGKIMSIPDELIETYFELLTHLDPQEMWKMKVELREKTINPMVWKKRLGYEIVSIYHGEKRAQRAQEEFEKVFKEKQFPEAAPVINFSAPEKEVWIGKLLTETGCVNSNSEVRRLIKQGGVYINNQRIEDEKHKIQLDGEILVRIGRKKFFKIIGKMK
ncbi:MAG: tyrosine--tRNA ligase [candidate division Zixibacteria bacterium RBG_16_40_9]|nr:MAG: tyrosine--tRNA ligase [candidate division Zixibacteria bacterium RBG_16_40_9]